MYKSILKITLISLTTVVLLFLVFKNADITSIWASLIDANFYWILLSLFFAILGYISRAMRWNLLIQELDYKPSLRESLAALMFGYLSNIAFPRIGEVSRCTILAKRNSYRIDALLGTVIAERAYDLICLFAILAALFIIRINFFGQFFMLKIFAPLLKKLETVNPMLFLVVIPILIVSALLLKKFSKGKISGAIKNIKEGILSGIRIKNPFMFLFHTIFIWGMYWAMTWVAFFAIEPTEQLNAIDALFVLVVGGLGMAMPVQGGIGVFHGAVAAALAIYGLDFHQEGLVFATLCHSSQMALVIVTGILSIIFFIKKNRFNGTVLDSN